MATIAPSRLPGRTEHADALTAAPKGLDTGRADFEELYRLHYGAALRVAHATVGSYADAQDAVAEAFARVFAASPDPRSVRPYLLAAVRNCAVDIVRRADRRERAEARRDRQAGGAVDSAAEHLLAEEEERLVLAAFAELPPRWQQALWLIDVEERSTAEAGSVLGVSANNAAQLASRARLRLRERYLQAHVPNHIGPGCSVTVAALGSFVAGTAPPRTRRKVDAHVLSCRPCQARLAELRDVASVLRRSVLPLPLLWAGARSGRSRPRGRVAEYLERWLGAVADSVPGRAVAGVLPEATAASPVVERLMAGTTAAVLVAGLSALAVAPYGAGSRPGSPAPAGSAGEVVVLDPAAAGGGPAVATGEPGARFAAAGVAGGQSVAIAPEAGRARTGVATGSGSANPPDATATPLADPLLSEASPSRPLTPLTGTNPAGAPSPAALAAPALAVPHVADLGPALAVSDLPALNLGTNPAAPAGSALAGPILTSPNLAGPDLPALDLSGATRSVADLAGKAPSGADLPVPAPTAVAQAGAGLAAVLGLSPPSVGPTPPGLPALDRLAAPVSRPSALSDGLLASPGSAPLGSVLPSPLPSTGSVVPPLSGPLPSPTGGSLLAPGGTAQPGVTASPPVLPGTVLSAPPPPGAALPVPASPPSLPTTPPSPPSPPLAVPLPAVATLPAGLPASAPPVAVAATPALSPPAVVAAAPLGPPPPAPPPSVPVPSLLNASGLPAVGIHLGVR